MNAPKDIRDAQGKPVFLGSMLGKGGEGVVFELNDKIAVKLYHSDKASTRAEKILAMVAAGWHSGSTDVAYPIEPLFKSNKRFAGFTMRRVGGRKAVHDLYSPASRKTYFPKADFRFLLHTSLNISSALAGVHATGCVVGDINHSGILMAPDTTATLIDSDSFQVSAGGKTYLCKVGVPEFTPPELQGQRLDQTMRTANHDAFGLGVLIFNLLFLGRHPFAGRFMGRGDMPMETAIAQYRFAYSPRRSETQMEPPPGVPTLDDIPPALAQAFERCFSKAAATATRPRASEWISLLRAAEGEIVVCKQSSAHHYFKNACSCPWCRMEQAYVGFVAFVPPVVVSGPTPANLGQLIAAIRAVPDPGQAPAVSAQMPAFTPQPALRSSITSHPKFGHYVLGLLGSVASVQLFYVSPPGPLFALAGLIGSAVLALRDSLKGSSNNELNQLRQSWRVVEERWRASTGNENFVETKRRAEDDIRQIQNLGAEESARIAQLRTKLREMQLHRFLDNYQITHAKIKGVGSTRKATLRSYGIETAADVQAARIQQISGFGPSMTALLVAWRTSMEKKFVFNPAQPINPQDVAQIQADVARKRIALQAALQKALTDLRSASSEIQTLRNSLKASAVQVWSRLKQDEADSTQIAFFGTNKPAWTFAAVVFVALLVTSNIRNISDKRIGTSSYAPSSQVSAAPKLVTRDPGRTQLPSSSIPTVSVTAPRKEEAPIPREPSPSMEVPSPKPADSAGVDLAPVETPPTTPMPQTRALVLGRAEDKGTRSISKPQDVDWIRERLRLAGFLKSSTHGSWDATTKSALRDFKITNGLVADDVLDAATVAKLSEPVHIRATQSFIGGWSSELACPTGVELEVSSKRAAVSTGACEFTNIVGEQGGWRIRANCRVAENSWTANIRLQVRADRLTWSSERGTTTYFRCR
jgi:DNA-binding helix-hairpin-helix protein with protein kinase domain